MSRPDDIEKNDNTQIDALLERAMQTPEASDAQPGDNGDAIDDDDADNKKEAETQEEREERAAAELKKVIKENAREDEQPLSRNFTLTKILGGDILSTEAIRSQIWLILLIVAFTVVYVANRYSCQKKLIEINRLNKELQNAKYKALSISSELTEMSRESNVLSNLNNNNDSTLKISSQPPYIIKIEE